MHKIVATNTKTATLSQEQEKLLNLFLSSGVLGFMMDRFTPNSTSPFDLIQIMPEEPASDLRETFKLFCLNKDNWISRPKMEPLKDSDGQTEITGDASQKSLDSRQLEQIQEMIQLRFPEQTLQYKGFKNTIGLPYRNKNPHLYQQTSTFHIDSDYFNVRKIVITLVFGEQGTEYVDFPVPDLAKFCQENDIEIDFKDKDFLKTHIDILHIAISHFLNSNEVPKESIKQIQANRAYLIPSSHFHRAPKPGKVIENRSLFGVEYELEYPFAALD